VSRNFSILSIMVMTVTVMLSATVAFATPNEGGNGQPKVTLCHKGMNTITVGEPAVAAHERHGDTLGACEEAPSEGTTPGLTGLTPNERTVFAYATAASSTTIACSYSTGLR
jgi:hypothetical protein